MPQDPYAALAKPDPYAAVAQPMAAPTSAGADIQPVTTSTNPKLAAAMAAKDMPEYVGAVGALGAGAVASGGLSSMTIPQAIGGAIGGGLGSAGASKAAENLGAGDTGQKIAGVAGGVLGGGLGSMSAGAAEGFFSSTARKQAAGALLQSVAHDANKVPVTLENTQKAALELMKWQKAANLGPTVNKFLNRITDPKQGPLTYEEGRQFYQIFGKMSVEETNRLPDAIKYQIQDLHAGLRTDLGNAADQVGKAAEYYQGLGDYRKAKNLEMFYNVAKKWLIRGAIGAAGAGAVGLGAKASADYLGLP